MPSEEELIAGFLSGKPLAEAEFVEVMQRHIRADVRNNFRSLLPQLGDIEQSALLTLCQMRENPREVARICPPIRALSKYLVDAPARVLMRIRKKTEPLGKWDEARAATQEGTQRLKELLDIVSESLPEGMARTLLAQSAHEMGDGPPLHEALGIDRRSADKRLARARIAVLRISRGDELEVEDE